MQLGHNSSQASISWCPGSPWGQSGHNGPIICMPTRKAQSSQCSVWLIVVSSPGNVGLQQTQHTAVLVLVLDYSSAVCALIVEHRAFVMQPGNLTSGAWQSPYTHWSSHSIPQHLQLHLQSIFVGENHAMKYFTVFPPRRCCVGSIDRLLIKWARSGFGAFIL